MSITKFTANKEDGTEVELFIKKPGYKEQIAAEKEYKKAFRKALEEGAMLRKRLHQYMIDQKTWDDSKEKEYQDSLKRINSLDYQLNRGKDLEGNKLPLSRAKEMAFELQDARVHFRNLISERQELDNMTAEGQADTERFSYYVYLCTYDYLTQKPYFSSLEEYVNSGNDPVAVKAAEYTGNVIYGIDDDYEDSLTENKFLKRFRFADNQNRLIDKEGNFIDREGNTVDEEGYILQEGHRVNINNLPVLSEDENVDVAEFEDDLGVITVETEESPKKKRTAAKTE